MTAPFYDRLNVARLVHDHWARVDVLDGEMEVAPDVRCVPMPATRRGTRPSMWRSGLAPRSSRATRR